MPGPKTTQTQTTNASTTTAPWEAAMPAVNKLLPQIEGLTANTGLTGTENEALGGLEAKARAGNQYLPGMQGLASDLLGNGERTGMVRDAYGGLKDSLSPYTTMDTNPYSNEAFTKATGFMTDDIMNRIKSQYAGAGYSPTGVGGFGKTVGEGIARGVAPAWLQAHNDLEARKMGAIEGTYNAGGQTAGLLTDLASRGIDVGNAANAAEKQPYADLLAIEAQRRGIPLQNVAGVENLIIPMAQLGGTSNTNSRTVGETETKTPVHQQILGAAMAGAGLLSGMPGLGMGGMGMAGAGGSMFGGAGLLGGFGGLGGLFGGKGMGGGGMGMSRTGGGLY
jgi:hypothetical protein